MATKRFIISQVYIPFLFNLASLIESDLIVLTSSYSEYVLAHRLRKRRKYKTEIFRLEADGIAANHFQFLEKRRGLKVGGFPEKKLLSNCNVSKTECVFLTWNSCEFIEQYIIRVLEIPPLIFELGYFRPKSLVIANKFFKHFPQTFIKPDEPELDMYGISNLLIDAAWKKPRDTGWTLIALMFYFELTFNRLRPRPLGAEMFKRFRNLMGPMLLRALAFLSTSGSPKKHRKVVAFFDQDPRDSSLLLDEFYVNRNRFIDNLIDDSINSGVFIVYRPHPLAADLANAWKFYRAGMEVRVRGTANELVANSDIISTFNSTVGFEALVSVKPLVILGNAFYRNNSGVWSSLNDCLSGSGAINSESRLAYMNRIKGLHHFNR